MNLDELERAIIIYRIQRIILLILIGVVILFGTVANIVLSDKSVCNQPDIGTVDE